MKPDRDREADAAAELRARARSVRLRALAMCLFAPLLAGYPGYFLLQELQMRLLGGRTFPVFSAAVAAGLPLLFGLRAAAKLARRTLLRRRGVWLDELAATYRVSRKELEKYTASWGM